MRKLLFTLSILAILTFTYFSYTVAKERWTKADFDTTVKIENHTPRRLDRLFSYFTLAGDTEVIVSISILLSFWALMRKKFWAFLGWLMIIPATFVEIFGKLVLFHPAPPVFFHRTVFPQPLPSFYIHTNFSYPSGHMTRVIFIITIIFVLVIFSKQNLIFKIILFSAVFGLAILTGYTRISLGEHWLSDVLGGAILGVGSGLFASILILPKEVR